MIHNRSGCYHRRTSIPFPLNTCRNPLRWSSFEGNSDSFLVKESRQDTNNQQIFVKSQSKLTNIYTRMKITRIIANWKRDIVSLSLRFILAHGGKKYMTLLSAIWSINRSPTSQLGIWWLNWLQLEDEPLVFWFKAPSKQTRTKKMTCLCYHDIKYESLTDFTARMKITRLFAIRKIWP